MKELIVLLTALQRHLKDCHYNFRGSNFIELHKWADETMDRLELDDSIDSLQEMLLSISNDVVMSQKEIVDSVSAALLPHPNTLSNEVLIQHTIKLLQAIENTIYNKRQDIVSYFGDAGLGADSLISSISERVTKVKALYKPMLA